MQPLSWSSIPRSLSDSFLPKLPDEADSDLKRASPGSSSLPDMRYLIQIQKKSWSTSRYKPELKRKRLPSKSTCTKGVQEFLSVERRRLKRYIINIRICSQLLTSCSQLEVVKKSIDRKYRNSTWLFTEGYPGPILLI